MKSVMKVCRLKLPEGTALGIRLHPSTLEGDEGVARLRTLIETYLGGGGTHVQFNVVDSKVLREAQAEPENYRDLIVRVWGFSTYFVDLTADYQEDIIARTEHHI